MQEYKPMIKWGIIGALLFAGAVVFGTRKKRSLADIEKIIKYENQQ